MTKRLRGAAAMVAAWLLGGLAGTAAAQEGTGAPILRLRGDEIRLAYPADAKAKGVEGEAIVTCQGAGGAVWACALASETPAGEGFGAAALALVKRYEAAAPVTDELGWSTPKTIRVPFKLTAEKAMHAGGAAYDLPRLLTSPSLGDLYEAWPRAARFSGVEGFANLWCVVNLEGRLTGCTVSQESRPGQGFGEAALKVTSLHRYAPARRDGAPVAMSIPVLVNFVCDVRCRRFEGAAAAPPVWASVPTPAEVQAAWPAAAKASGQEGQARLDCLTLKSGGLEDCRVVAESPAGQGFGAAALSLAGRFGVTAREPGRLSFSVAFDQRTGQVDWIWDDFLNDLLWGAPKAKAAAQARGKPQAGKPPPVQGRSRLRCQVVQGGRLDACIVLESTPPDPEVARQALANLETTRVRDWTEEGRSTIGAVVELTASAGQSASPEVVAAPAAPPVVPPGVVDYRPQKVLSDPVDMSRYYPDRAQRMEVGGRAVLSCTGFKDGHPEVCTVQSESPAEYGFGEAALKMMRAFRYSPQTIDGVPTSDPILLPFEFAVP